MVATCSFGMGVNRPDIRYVFRVDYPATLEEFMQEIGRSGRDGLPAQGIFMLPKNSSIVQFYLKNKSNVEQAALSKSYLDMWKFVHTDRCRRQFILQVRNVFCKLFLILF